MKTAAAVDFQALRAEFPTTRKWAYLNIANKAPLPRAAEEAASAFFRDIRENAGAEAFSNGRVEAARESLARLLGVPSATLAFIKNTSEGLNIAAQALDLRAGENVLLTDKEHLNQIYAWRHLEARGVEVRWVRARGGRLPVEAFTGQMDAKTRAAALSYVTYGNGCRVDLPALCAACRERGIVSVVDGIQALGALAAPIPALGADIMVTGAHKGLLGLNGSGILYCREELIPRLRPPFVARSSMTAEAVSRAEAGLAPDARRFEYGNPNYLGLWVLRASADFLAGIGLDRIEERIRALTTQLMEMLEERRLDCLTPRPWEERAGIVSIAVPDPEGTVARLRREGIVAGAKDGALRVSVHFYNSEEDLTRLVRALS